MKPRPAALVVGYIVTAALVLGAATVLLLPTPAWTHMAQATPDNPIGWQYGLECCSLNDCRQVPHGAVEETPKGYVIKATRELIPYGDRAIKQSKDEYFHHCTAGGTPVGRTICLYVPNRGF